MCVPAISRSMSRRRRTRGSGQRSVAQRYGKQDATVMGTIALIVCPGMKEEEEADSQSTGADLQGQACETWGKCQNR